MDHLKCVRVCIKLIIDCYIVIAVCGHGDVEQQSNIEMQKHDRWPFCLFFFFRFLSLISNLSKIWFNKKNFYSSKEDKKKMFKETAPPHRELIDWQ